MIRLYVTFQLNSQRNPSDLVLWESFTRKYQIQYSVVIVKVVIVIISFIIVMVAKLKVKISVVIIVKGLD